ncbi:hypothetical protein LJB87_00990 [Alistipes sp. OttesenSCG-928-L06]|nr:hypothetical protein [Alistipes sp. OttesenSCG-928-L06]
MLESIITDYLRQNRRLVIPELGAFLKKEGGEVVFAPFLNKDDGILNGLVRQTYGASSTEAEGIISKYVETVRQAVGARGGYLLSPLGSLKKDPNGLLFLDPADLTPGGFISKTAITEEVTGVPEEAVITESELDPEPESEVVLEPAELPIEENMPEPEPEPEPEPAPAVAPVLPEPEERQVIADTVDAPRTLNDLIREHREEQAPAPTVHSRIADSEAVAKPSPKLSRPVSAAPAQPSGTTPSKAKRGDLVLIIAVLVAIIAVAAMIYAYAIVDLPLFNLK